MNRIPVLTLMLYACAIAQSHDFASSGYASGAAEYLKLPVHASSAALGTAVVASRDNLANAQYNPAILDALPEGTINGILSYTIMTLDRKFCGADLAGNLGNYCVGGISYANLGVNNFDGRDDAGIQTGSFRYSTNAFAAMVAGRLAGGIAVGGTFRYVNEQLADAWANGIGLDIGATWGPLSFLTIGLSAQNLGSYLWWSTGTRDQVLPTGRIGACANLLNKTLLVETDFIKTYRQPEEMAAGIQYYLLNMLYVRGGITTAIDMVKQTSRYPDYALGVGMRYTFFGFDYACLIPDSELGLTHKISLCAAIKGF